MSFASAHCRLLVAQPARFGSLPRPCDEHGLLAFIATTRHLAKAGEPDIARATTALLNDLRSGALGRITLETVEG